MDTACPDCKRLFEAAREAIQAHIRAEGNWKVSSLRRDEASKVQQLRALHDTAAVARQDALVAYRAHAATHECAQEAGVTA
jgi:predicted DsbA family dithiol-disulfide isomerase